MADSGHGDASNQGSSSVSTKEKGSRNKRKYLSDFSVDVPVDGSSSSLTEFPRYELVEEKFRNALSTFGLLNARSDQPKEEEVEESKRVDWDDPIACQFEELLSDSLYATFGSAIKKISECGYSEEVAEWVVLRSGLYYGDKDVVSNIVDGALLYLRSEKEFDTSRHHLFEVLQNLVEYTMLEMISVLMEVKPSLSVAEAMWCLLICDLNLSHACAMEGDPLSALGGREVPGESSSESTLPQSKSEAQTSESILLNPSKPHISKSSNSDPQKSRSEIPLVGESPNLLNVKIPLHREASIMENGNLVSLPVTGGKSVGSNGGHIQTVSQTTVMVEKSGVVRKCCSGNSKRDMLRQKTLHMEKCYRGRMSRAAFKAKLTSLGGLVLDKKQKSPSDSSGTYLKNASSKVSTAVGVNPPPAERNHHLSCKPLSVSPATDTHATLPLKDTVSELPAANTELSKSIPLETKPTSKPEISTPLSSKTPDYYGGIPYDKSMKKYVPQNDKDEILLALVPRMQVLQKELQGWTNWTNEKVMQAARRLSKDQAELKALRQEKEETEKFKKEKQIVEENTMKRLLEMEYALSNATRQIEMANSTVSRLELENSVLKKEMGAARLQALRSAADLQEAVLREQETLKKVQSCEPRKGLLQEDLKHKAAGLQQGTEKAKGLHNQIEVLFKQEEKEKVKLLIQASSIRKERERLEALAKEEEENIRRKGENELRRYKDSIKNLETEISKLRLESESSKIAALLRGINWSYGIAPTDSNSAPALQGYQTPNVHKRLPVFRDNFGAGSVKPERECVMCMTEEMSVVFLPCAHQVLCASCSVLHEKQGMNDCPSCRTPIQMRINVRFAKE